MANNETKIFITAATAQAEAALAKLGQSVGGLSRQMFDMSGVLGTLGGALTVTAFAGIIKQSIDAADELNNLSIKTGTSVEQLAGLKYAAEQSDTSLQAVAGAAKKLSSNLAENPDLFRKFGIDAKDSTGALIQLADIFATMPDGVEKTALAVKLMGKSGEEMIPFLNQGGEAIRSLVEQGKEYNPVTAESARLAAEFNDNLDKLSASAGSAGMAMTNDLLPQLADISTAMATAAREGGLLKAAWVGLGGLGTALFTDDMLPRMQQINNELEKLRRWEKELDGSAISRMFHPGDLRDTRAQIILLENELKSLQKTANAPAKKPDEQPSGTGKGKSLLSALGGGDKSASKAPKTDPNDSAVLAMQNEEFRKQMELLGVSSEQIKVYELAMKGATKAQIEQAQAAADSIGAINAQIQAEKERAKAAAEAQKIILDIDPVARQQAELEKLNKLKEQGLLTDDQVVKAMEKVKNSGTDTFASLENAVRGWGDQFTNTLTDMVLTGKGSFSDLANSIIRDMMRMQIQKNITEPLMTMGSDFFSGLFKNADGGVYSGPGISAYSGSVVSQPTVFPFARGIGLMGEAGPEAILPLTRVNGKLGVQAQGAGGAPSVVVNVVNQSGQNVTARQQGGPQFNGRDWVLGIVLDAADSDPQFRNAMGMSR